MGNCWGTRVKAESPVNSAPSPSGNSRPTKCSPPPTQQMSSTTVSTESYPSPRTEGEILQLSNLRRFSFTELKNATRNFRPDNILGAGGFGYVFKGWIDEQGLASTKPGMGVVVAVKELNQKGLQGHKEWLAEVTYLGQLQHPNLVKLVGYCVEDDHRLLVYEFMSKGSLEYHLFRSSFKSVIFRGFNYQPLSWTVRVKIAIGAAKGLAFLHSTEPQVIYRDFKTSNILLDSNYNAKLSDFGLAKDGPTGDKTHVSTRVMGTLGYAAPEYVATGHLTSRSDVYSFGVVLLEMLSGRRVVDKNRPVGEQKLVEWATPYLQDKRKLYHVMDPRLEGQYPAKGAHTAAMLALQCLDTEAKFRPHMKEVLEVLDQLQNNREIAKDAQPVQSRKNQSAVANGHGHFPQNINHPSPGYPKPSSSPLHLYQQSPRVR